MKPSFDNKSAIYIQIMDEMKMRIVSGILNAGDKVLSVRELAEDFGVNPNTMQRALSELERENLLYTERTSGRFITEDGGLIMELRDVLSSNEINRFLQFMFKIGYHKEDIIEKINAWEERAV